ncbi:MAG: hypothetical protein AAF546_11110, partial [Verrucomicrobiota bacterium]
YGNVRDVLLDESGSIYFRGGGSYTVSQNIEWMNRQTFYTKHGDWFVFTSGILAVTAFPLILRRRAIRLS